MFGRKLFRICFPLALLAAGFWLLARSTGPAPESVVYQQAIQALAPSSVVQSDGSRPVPDRVVADPVVVDLAQIPPRVYDPQNQRDRWLRGEIDLHEGDGLRSAAEIVALREAARKLQPNSRIQQPVEAKLSTLAAPSILLGFDSLDYTECCGGGGNVPPDPELAVGPNHMIAVVNVAFEIYDKSGNSLAGPTTFASFMAANPNCNGVFDPNVLYDEEANRYILGIDANGSHYCLAVSQTGNPTGSWNIYSFATGNMFFDYPHAGVGRDAIYMGANMFRCRASACTFAEGRIWAFDKWAMYNGQSASSVSRSLGSNNDTPQPMNLHGWNQGTWPASGPHYFITETGFNGADHTLYAWTAPFGSNTLTTAGQVNLNTATGITAGFPLDVPQSGGGSVQANDWRPLDFEYRNGYGWTTMTIACNPGGGSVNCVRWAQINLATATVVQAGVFASNGEYRFFPDLAVNHCNDMAVGYTKSSASIFPAIWYTGREGGDAAGTLQPEAQLKAGEIAYTSFEASPPRRWGDYTGMTVDPDGVTFWYLGEYSKNTGTSNGRWGTYIGSFDFGSCSVGGPGPTPTPPPGPTPTATPVPGGNTMHVGDLDGSSSRSGGSWTATVSILIVNQSSNAVNNATVNGSWSAGGNASCTTAGNGLCNVTLSNIPRQNASVTFTVNNVTHATLSYNAADNTDPDGDSNGTVITVNRP